MSDQTTDHCDSYTFSIFVCPCLRNLVCRYSTFISPFFFSFFLYSKQKRYSIQTNPIKDPEQPAKELHRCRETTRLDKYLVSSERSFTSLYSFTSLHQQIRKHGCHSGRRQERQMPDGVHCSYGFSVTGHDPLVHQHVRV